MRRPGHSTQPEDFFFESPPPPRAPEKRKPLVRLVCPCCGVIVFANALDGAGTTPTYCAKCEGTIWIETDEDGAIVGIDGEAKETVSKKKFEMDWRAALVGAFLALFAVGFLYMLIKAPAAPTVAPTPPGVAPASSGQLERLQ